jgi:CHAD domain-containing protein
MAFQLRTDESVTHGLRRLARKELQSARRELQTSRPPRDAPVHEARKSVKKVRAILQLIDDDQGGGLNGDHRSLRSVNRTLSDLRDADVLMETLAKLRAKHPHVMNEQAFARARRLLAARKRAAAEAVQGKQTWKAVDRKLRTVRRDAKRWQPDHPGAGALKRGIRAAHQRGRTEMKRAQKEQTAATFHGWRKEMKALWYALRLIEQSDSRVRRDIRALHRAETLLGDEHNLVVLCAELSSEGTICRGPLDIDRLRLAADHDQCRLREKASARIRYIYQRRSGAYARDIARLWKKWCRQQS